MLFYFLAESVSERMKAYNLTLAKTVHISVVDKDLGHYAFQCPLPLATSASEVIADTATQLFKKHINTKIGIRGVGVSVTNFMETEQLLIGDEQNKKEKSLKLDKTMENLRARFGKNSIDRAVILKDKRLSTINPTTTSINTKEIPKD